MHFNLRANTIIELRKPLTPLIHQIRPKLEPQGQFCLSASKSVI